MEHHSFFGITRELLEAMTTCPLCFEGYNENTRPAKFLPCLHSFCLICLDKHVQGEGVFKCPLCRRYTNVPGSGVRGFPDNFIVANLTDLKPVDNADKTTALKCGSCTDGGTTAAAVGFCYRCQVFLCRSCEEAHVKMRAFNDHVVRTMEQLQNPSKLPQQGLFCDQHKQERLTLFCTDAQCQKVLCLLCAHTRHQGHPTIELAERSSEVMRELNSLVEQARQKVVNVREISGRINTEINRTSRLYEESEDTVRRFFGALQGKLTGRMTNANAFSNKMCIDRTNLLRRQTDLAESLVSQFESACQFVETACGTGNPVHLLWARDQVCGRLEELNSLDLAQHIPFKPTSDDVFKSFTADQEWALGEFEKIFRRLGIFTVSICDCDFEVDFPKGEASYLITKALQVVRLRLSDPSGQLSESLIDRLDAFLLSPDGNSTDCGISRQSDTDVDGCEIQFQPMVSGTHKLNISVSGVPIKGSPFSFQVMDSPLPEPVDVEKEISSDVTWSPDVFARCEHTVFVKLHGIRECQRLTARYFMQDQSTDGPESDIGDELLETDPDRDGETEATIVSTTDEGTFQVVFTPPRAGRLIMSILVDGRPIRKQPFLVSVSPLHPDSSEIHCAQMGMHIGPVAVLNMPYSIVVSMHDYQGNRLHTGGHSVIASVATETSHEIQNVVKDNQNGSYSIEFTPRSLDLHSVNISICGHQRKGTSVVDIARNLPFQDPPSGYKRPTGIAIDKETNIVLVADGRQSCIHRLGQGGRSALEPIAISTRKSVQIAMSKLGKLVMLEPAQNSVTQLSASTGQEEQRWSCASETTAPANVFFSKDGKVVICDCQSQKLFLYEIQGTFVSHIQLHQNSLTGGCMNNACCLPNNDVIVATNRPPYGIHRYTIAGDLKSVSVSPAHDDQLAVASTEEGTIIISSVGKVMILAMRDNGSLLVLHEFATDRIYTSLSSTGDGCFMAFDPGRGFHLDKYSHLGYSNENNNDIGEILV